MTLHLDPSLSHPKTRPSASLPRVWVLAACLLAGLAPASRSIAGSEAGVQFRDGPIEKVLAEAAQQKKNILVEVWATWCAPCKQQQREVFETAEGAKLTEKLLAWRVDFDAPEHQTQMKAWKILKLPTVLFLRPDGTEIDRIEGYDDKGTFMAHAKRAAAGEDPVLALRARWEKLDRTKGVDREEVRKARQVLGHKLLVRGQTKAGRNHLLAVADEGAGKSEAAQDALYVLGRYRSRVLEDHAGGLLIWQRLWNEYPQGKHADTALWWSSSALDSLNRKAEADALMIEAATARPSTDRLSVVVSWIEKTGRLLPGLEQIIDRAHLTHQERAEIGGRLLAMQQAVGQPPR